MRQIYTIKGNYTKKQLDTILGEPSWEWEADSDDKPACGLASGDMWSAGWGDSRACCRIWIHSDGICIGTGLDIPEDREYAGKVYRNLKRTLSKEESRRSL